LLLVGDLFEKYMVLIAFDRYYLPLFCHACGPLPKEAILIL
jgi:hypothetical protein